MNRAGAIGKSELTTLAICLVGWAVLYLGAVFGGEAGWLLINYVFHYPVPVGAFLVSLSYVFVCKRHPKEVSVTSFL